MAAFAIQPKDFVEPPPAPVQPTVAAVVAAPAAHANGTGSLDGEKKDDEDELKRKRMKCCDEIFAEYLASVSRKVNKDYYKKVVMFTILLRECVNESADKLNEEKKSLPANLFPVNEARAAMDNKGKDYCAMNNAEQVPDVSNDFIMNYLEQKDPAMETQEAIDLIQNLCHWLFINGYTCSKISLIQ